MKAKTIRERRRQVKLRQQLLRALHPELVCREWGSDKVKIKVICGEPMVTGCHHCGTCILNDF
jgi:hypothetical protein